MPLEKHKRFTTESAPEVRSRSPGVDAQEISLGKARAQDNLKTTRENKLAF